MAESSSDRIPARIRWVAEAIGETEEFRRRASRVASELGAAGVPVLGTQFHSEHTPPDDLTDRFRQLGAWMAARQFAIFEILFHIGPPSLPLLRTVAFGDYDWIQGNAIEVLCRLAASGIERTKTMAELKLEMPRMRDEALLYAAGPLLAQLPDNPALGEVVGELLEVEEFRIAWQEARGLGVLDGLQEAIAAKDRVALEFAVAEVDPDDVDSDPIVPILCGLLAESWHFEHERLAQTLQRIRDPRASRALAAAATLKFDHMAADDSYPFARKCTWALADIGTDEARAYLVCLAMNSDAMIAGFARRRLDEWQAESNRKRGHRRDAAKGPGWFAGEGR